MKKLVLGLIIVFAMGLFAPLDQTATAQTGTWTAEYFANPNLNDPPVLTLQDTDINENWGLGAPSAGMPADNFSVRWTSFPVLDAGTYEVDVLADDGVRVIVDGTPVIDEFRPAPGVRYTDTFSVSAGQHTLVVEYYEGGGSAYVTFALNQIAGQPPATPGEATATVTAYFLNVRDAPSMITGKILTVIERGQTYPIVGRNAAGTWWQINANGTIGWISGAWVNTTNAQNVPVTSNIVATVTAYFLNVRDAPSAVTGEILTRITRGETYPVVGRNPAGTWWLLDIDGVRGWVSDSWITVNDTTGVPIVTG